MKNINTIFQSDFPIHNSVIITSDNSSDLNQQQTNSVFSDKWEKYSEEEIANQEKLFQFQKEWYLTLYGFPTEADLQDFLVRQDVILDAGCGLGYKAKWFADLSPQTLVIGMDFSDAVFLAAKTYAETTNLRFVKGDIADTKIINNAVSYVSCDQVIHHTEDPQKTMQEFSRILMPQGELAVYVYAKKALPRELVDDYFRIQSKNISNDDMWKMSEQLTELGKRLSELNVTIDVPDIPLLGIKGGEMDIQRFIYWNFLKCFWNESLGRETSTSTNFDWYAPSNAARYSRDEFLEMSRSCNLEDSYLHSEEACHSGRFIKRG